MARLEPPAHGAAVRMYRQGHGDCFLLAFPRPEGGRPFYVMIDCGYKPGSQAFLDHGKSIGEIVAHLHDACEGHLDLVLLTHEHQDHLNGLWKPSAPFFQDFEVEELWLAWTEDPTHPLANELRRRHHDQLLGLLAARRELALAAGDGDETVARLDALLAFELGGGEEAPPPAALLAAAEDPEKSVNKQGIKLLRDKATARKGCSCLTPGTGPLTLAGTGGVRAFIFGPPESAELIADEDPHDGEGFPGVHALSFSAAAQTPLGERTSPFSRHFAVPLEFAFDPDQPFFTERYGPPGTADDDRDRIETGSNPPWRRIDSEWLHAAETLALKLNTGINNTSLVVAFELPRSQKVLFFAADAQRGNWFSWKDVAFTDGSDRITAKDLLERAVLYKVGHHGSHNATLDGTPSDPHPNLSWLARGAAAGEFTAMITAVNEWATTQNHPPWVHPWPAIKTALVEKARGRVLQTDENQPAKPDGVSDVEWQRFTDRVVFADTHFDWTVEDS